MLKLLFKILVALLGGLISVLIHSSTLSLNIYCFPSYSPFCYSLVFFPMESDDNNTPQQQQEEGDIDTGGKKKCSSQSDSLFPLSESSRKAQRREAQCRLKQIQCELEKLKLVAEDDSEGSDVAENICRRKSGAVYQECPIKPEKLPGKNLSRWELWVKHYKSVVEANGWSDMQAIEALPACLTSWAVEEFETVPRQYVEKVLGEKTPQFDALLDFLEPKMQQYCSKRAARSEFKAVKKWKTKAWMNNSEEYLISENLHFQKNHSRKEIRIYEIRFWIDSSTFGCNRNFMKTKQTAIFAKFYTGPMN